MQNAIQGLLQLGCMCFMLAGGLMFFGVIFGSCGSSSSTSSHRSVSNDPALQREGDVKVVDMQPDGRGGYIVTVDRVVRK